ncbi:YpuI family protein [Paenibacillus daejeonensis]|uniref:YpuI family protein n=1 Tax=Paenibacillus daejeonensis TaxID=135193 RepID=UPI00037F79E8|nr:YpuI family protein [Paenibacillus daejeonensis]
MPASNVKQLSESTHEKLKTAISQLEEFLNQYAVPQLTELDSEDQTAFYKGLLSDLRHLLVFSEVAYEKLGALLRRPNFDTDAAERTLYEVYHQCVNAYFYPKNEGYSEDGRYAYTGRDAIRFLFKPVEPARDIVLTHSKIFEELRDDLGYYETDYMTHVRMQRQK